jgi:hypothetical protein
MITLIFILVCYGICNILIYGSIFDGFRNLLSKLGTGGYSLFKLFTCFLCLSVWIGFAMTLILNYFGYPNLTPIGSLGINNIYLMTFLNGMLSSGGVWIVHTLQEYFEK